MSLQGASRKKEPSAGMTYQLKITLRRSSPPIWRRILVPADCNLEVLHAAIQRAMGWSDSHLHVFEIAGEEYMGCDPMGGAVESDGRDAAKYRLSEVVRAEKAKFNYQYDFGDSWDHVITVEKILQDAASNSGVKAAQPFLCVAGAGACPLENCGGIWGYYNLLAILSDPKHEEHADLKDWAGGAIDPTAFDLGAINERLRRIRPR